MRSDLPERSFEFARRIVMFGCSLQKQHGASHVLAKQLLGAGTSVGANIEEGQSSQSEADFISTYAIACKEASETRYRLRFLAASELADSSTLAPLLDESNQLISILTTIIKKLRSKSSS